MLALAVGSVSTLAQENTDSLAKAVSAPDGERLLPHAGKDHVTFALKSNLLYDALATPNVGFEAAFARHISLSLNWTYAWWSRMSKFRYWRMRGADIEARWWFKNRVAGHPMTGHHLGVYYSLFDFDLKLGNTGTKSMQWMASFGLAYGYSISLSRHLNLDFAIKVGYARGKMMKYRIEGGEIVETKRISGFFGPTGAEISLIWLL